MRDLVDRGHIFIAQAAAVPSEARAAGNFIKDERELERF
jgi:hypothetical protein